MTHCKLFGIQTIRTFALVISLGVGTVANAQGPASQPATDSGRPETDALSDSQRPADAVVVHEGAGPVDCARLLAQENIAQGNTQSANVNRANDEVQSDAARPASPHREDQPGADTQISTLEECRTQQDPDANQQSYGAGANGE